ncbi:MAG: DNA-binding protein WhiA [Clostridia bacterium]|nr:DNA-binding protein WhiA [Clostridia bacterium]
MGFSNDVKSELLREPMREECCARAEMCAFFMMAGSISLKGFSSYALTVSSENAAVVRYGFTQIRQFLGIAPELRTARTTQLGEHLRYQMTVEGEDAMRVMEWLDMKDSEAFLGIRREPSEAILEKDCCKRAYIRGAFLTNGWLNMPEKAYHLEFAVQDERHAEILAGLLSGFEIHAKAVLRKTQWVVYVKDYEQLSEALGVLGAFQAYMSLENVKILKQLHNNVNRQMNCDDSNTDKTVRAAEAQLQDIEYIQEHGGLDQMPRPLQQIAEARINYPDANLAELGALLDPPIGKSGVNNRIRRMMAFAQQLRESRGEI